VTGNKINLAPLAMNQAFKQLRDHAGTTLGTAAALCLPIAFISLYTALRPGWGPRVFSYLAGALIGVVVGYVVTAATGMYAEENDPGVKGLFGRAASPGLFRFIATTLLFNLILAGVLGMALVPFFFSLGSIGPQRLMSLRLSEADFLRLFFGLMASLPLMVVATLFVYLKLGVAPQASVLDGTGPAASIRRSWQVTKGRAWDLFVLLSLMFAISLAISIVVSGPAGLVSAQPVPEAGADPLSPSFYRSLFGPPEPLGPAAAMVTAISGYLSTLLLTSLTAAMLANFYLYARNPPQPAERRKEGRSTRMVPLRLPADAAGEHREPPASRSAENPEAFGRDEDRPAPKLPDSLEPEPPLPPDEPPVRRPPD